MRHVTEPYLRPAAGDLWWWQLYMLDVITLCVVGMGMIVVAAYQCYKVMKYVLHKCNLWYKSKKE